MHFDDLFHPLLVLTAFYVPTTPISPFKPFFCHNIIPTHTKRHATIYLQFQHPLPITYLLLAFSYTKTHISFSLPYLLIHLTILQLVNNYTCIHSSNLQASSNLLYYIGL